MNKKKPHSDAIEAPETDYLYIKKSRIPKAGKGLFTAVPIYKEEVIAVYKGEILTEHQSQLRADKGNDRYFIAMLDGSIMDSMKVKCYAKYANDADGTPNSGFKNNAKIVIDDHDNVCLEATRNIKENEEIFCSYGKRYWKKHGLS